jgi:hypothetical protein
MYEDVKPLVTALITAAVTIIGIATPLVCAWLRNYFSVRENAAMNQTVTAAASREGAMLLSASPDLKAVNIGWPPLVALARDLMSHYPEYCDRLGLDLNLAQGLILGEAHKLYNTGYVPTVSVQAPDAVTSVTVTPRSSS